MKSGPILLIDDDKDECELVGDALAHQKIENKLICFANGKEALAFLQSTGVKPFLILTDINMPVMGGLKLRQKIQEDEELKKKAIPFVFLTTSATQHAVNLAYEMCVQGFFEKPNSFEELAKLLNELCSYWGRCRHPNNI